jgi:hypothetical protein
MTYRALATLGAVALTISLAACSGGGSNSTPAPSPATPGPGSLTTSASSLSFAGPGAAAQSFTVSSSLGNLGAPAFNSAGCAPVASIATTSTSLPATYTVTPTGNGTCTFVIYVAHQAVTVGINVGGGSGPSISQSTSSISVFVGGTSGSVTVTASSGTLVPDASACAGIAAIGGSGGASPQTFTIGPVAAGNCTLVVVDGSSSVLVPIVVNANPGGTNALSISPSTLDFASQNAAPQQATLSFTGNAGTVSINENDCIGLTGKLKIAYATVGTPGQPVTLPAAVTVTPYTPGSDRSPGTCTMTFTSSVGATPTNLTVIVH